jgi:hypothetical protein
MRLEQDPVATTAPGLDYRGIFGWPVHAQGERLELVVGSGIAAVALPKSMAQLVLERVARQGCSGPALSRPTRNGTVVIILAEADTLPPPERDLPPEVRMLPAGTAVPLPDGHGNDERARWLVAPDTRRRWLPSLAAILAGIHSIRPRLRS